MKAKPIKARKQEFYNGQKFCYGMRTLIILSNGDWGLLDETMIIYHQGTEEDIIKYIKYNFL